MSSRFWPRTAVAVALTLLTVSAALVPARAQRIPMGEAVDGIHCDAAEGVAMHIHQHLAIFDHGRPVLIPQDVGRPLGAGCFYWLHTHTPDGIIHVESPKIRTFTLGEFFAVWGEPLARRDVAGAIPKPGEKIRVYVDGDPYTGDPAKIELTQHLDVNILVGPPYRKPAAFTAWNGN